MVPAAKGKALVAIDLGAQSCRVSLLRWRQNQPAIEIVHRFENSPVSVAGRLFWDIQAIFEGVKTGLKRCCGIAREGIASIGVDGWAVDYVRLDALGNPAELPFCYRDARTEAAEDRVHTIVPESRLYSMTGIQILRINTLYQLYSDQIAGSDCSLPWLNLPEYIAYRLCGKRVSEYTNATHTGLVALGTHSWCQQIFRELGLDLTAAPEIVPTGSLLGALTGDLSALPALRDARVIVPACHDTASAIAAIPAAGNDWAFISSGTWSLVGTVLDSPCTTNDAHRLNFTNLGGVGGKSYFLKNVNGLWLLQQCLSEWQSRDVHCSLEDLIEECSSLPVPAATIDVDDPLLMLPGNTIDKINRQLKRLGQRTLSDRLFINGSSRQHDLSQHGCAIRGSACLHCQKSPERNSTVCSSWVEEVRTIFSISSRPNAQVSKSFLELTESTTIGNFAIQMAVLEQRLDSRSGCDREVGRQMGRTLFRGCMARSDSAKPRIQFLSEWMRNQPMEGDFTMNDKQWNLFGRRSTISSLSCLPGDLPIPAPASASSSSPPPPLTSKKSSATPHKSTPSPAPARLWPFMFSGICRTV